MFCTDVLRAWAECSLKDFSQAWRKGFGYSGREMALIHHTELGRLEVRASSISLSLSFSVAVWRNVHRVHNLNGVV